MLVFENPNRAPLTSEYQLGESIAVQVTPYCAADQADLRQGTTILGIDAPAVRFGTKDERGAGLRIASGNHPTTHEEIKASVALNIRQSQRPSARGLPWK